MQFVTEEGVVVPAVSAEQMGEVDRIAVEEFGLGILQMMENAGRSLAEHAMDMMGDAGGEVAVLAGSGGNGGGGLCCARHLHNRAVHVSIVLDRESGAVRGAAAQQLAVLHAAGLRPLTEADARTAVSRASLVVDALIGYGLRGAPVGRTSSLIDLCNTVAPRVLSLDVPSGIDATTGQAPGAAVRPERTLTLALPKTGLRGVGGTLYVADLGIPPEVFHRIGIAVPPMFSRRSSIRLRQRHSL